MIKLFFSEMSEVEVENKFKVKRLLLTSNRKKKHLIIMSFLNFTITNEIC